LLIERDLLAKLDEVDSYLKHSKKNESTNSEGLSLIQLLDADILKTKTDAYARLRTIVKEMESRNEEIRSGIETRKTDLLRRCSHAVDKQHLYDKIFDQILSTANNNDLETLVDRMINM